MSPLDPEAERDLRGRRRALGLDTDEILSVPGDRRDGEGKKWWTDVYGKAAGGILAAIGVVFVWWLWGLTVSAYAATIQLYSLDPRLTTVEGTVSRHEMQMKALSERQMSGADVTKLAREIATEMEKQRKGKR